jgi:ketosteroid isomerase-like protein
VGELLDHVRGYYEALNTGDADAVAAFFTDDAVHYYTRMAPHRGREIAERAAWAVNNIDAEWSMYNGIDDGEQAVIEWSMKWRHLETGEVKLDRGTEWFLFAEDGRIREVRAYYNRSGDLIEFDHAGRGHTVL